MSPGSSRLSALLLFVLLWVSSFSLLMALSDWNLGPCSVKRDYMELVLVAVVVIVLVGGVFLQYTEREGEK